MLISAGLIMTEKLDPNDLRWLREIAVADRNVERRIPQLSLAKLLKFALVASRDMRTLHITRRGWRALTVAAPELAEKRSARAITYALVADNGNNANLRVE